MAFQELAITGETNLAFLPPKEIRLGKDRLKEALPEKSPVKDIHMASPPPQVCSSWK
jgi:hypothetical protein